MRAALKVMAVLAVATSAAAALALYAPEEPTRRASAVSPAMTDSKSCGALDVDKSMTLDPSCTYRTIRITRSDVVLDCNGATIDLGHKGQIGLRIGRLEGLGEVSNVVVRNCTIRGARKYGIYIGAAGCERDKLKLTEAQRYARHPQKILLENVTVELSGNTGLYVDDYVSDVTVRDSTFLRNAGTAIYLEHHSRRARIAGNHFIENGHGTKYVAIAKGNREAIAIDASQHNVIENNEFVGNYAGAVFLYRNCWEHPESPCQVNRGISAAHNIIRNNDIRDSRTAIWLASRQHRSADTRYCGQRPDPAKGIYNDDAKDNLVTGNRISGVERGIVAADDGNVIERNEIANARDACIVAGSEQRSSHFKAPVTGLKVTGNICRLRRGQAGEAAISVVAGTKVTLDGNKVER